MFRSEIFLRTTQELEYFFFVAQNAIFFPEFNIRLYDKNSESDYFFFLHQNQNIFFSNSGNQNIFLEKQHIPPFKLNGRSLNINDEENRSQDTILWYPACDMMAFELSAIYNYFLYSVAKKTFNPLNYFLTYFIPMHLMQKSLSKAFIKSIYTESILPPLSRILVHSSITFRSCKVVDLPEMKPNCLLLKSLLADMCFTIVSLTSFSMVLQITLVYNFLVLSCLLC